MSDLFYPNKLSNPKTEKLKFNDTNHICYVIDITGAEYEICDTISSNLWSNTKSGFYGSGILNSKKDPYKTERIGLLGEFAVAKTFGLGVNISYFEGGDKQDFIIKGKSVDVKCASRCYGAILIMDTNEYGKKILVDEKIKDMYIGAYLRSEDRIQKCATIVLVGFTQKMYIQQIPIVKARRGFHMNKEVLYENLMPIEKLMENHARNID